MSGEHFEQNLAALLTRALPDDAPSPAFRRRVALAVEVALRARADAGAPRDTADRDAALARTGRTEQRRDRGPRVGRWLSLAAALVTAVLGFAWLRWSTGAPPAQPGGAPADLVQTGDPRSPGAAVAVGPRERGPQPDVEAPPAGGSGLRAPVEGPPEALAGPGTTDPDRADPDHRTDAAQGGAGQGRAGQDGAGQGAAAPEDTGALAEAQDAAGQSAPSAAGPPAGAVADLWLALRAERAPTGVRVWTRLEVEVPDVAEPTVHVLAEPEFGPAGSALVRVPASAGARYTVVVEAEGCAPWRASGLTACGPEDAHAVQLAPGAPVSGVVVDAASGAPLADALVLVETALPHQVLERHGEDLAPLPLHAVHTDLNGAFAIPHAPAGDLVLRASRPGYAPGWSAVAADSGAAPGSLRVAPTLALGAGARVHGRVERSDGTPWAGADVILSQLPGGRRQGAGAAPMTFGGAVTDSEGRYEVAHLPPGAFVALCLADTAEGAPRPRMQHLFLRGTGAARADFLAPEGAERGIGLRLALSDANGVPLAALDLSLYEVQGGAMRNLRTDSEGKSEVFGLTPGLWAVCRAERGYRDQVVLGYADLRNSSGLEELALTLAPGALRVAIAGPTGAPVSGGRLTLEREVRPGQFEFHATWGVDSAGATTVEGLFAGRYRATVAGAELGLGHLRGEPFEHDGQKILDERIELPVGGALTVRVSDERSGSTVGAVVVLRDSAGAPLALGVDQRTDAGGVRSFPALAPGRYSVTVRAFDGREHVSEVQVLAGADVEHAVPLR